METEKISSDHATSGMQGIVEHRHFTCKSMAVLESFPRPPPSIRANNNSSGHLATLPNSEDVVHHSCLRIRVSQPAGP